MTSTGCTKDSIPYLVSNMLRHLTNLFTVKKKTMQVMQANSDMLDPVGPEKLVRHMQVCMLLHWGPHLIGIKVKTA